MQQVRPSTSPQPVIDAVGGRLDVVHRPLGEVRAAVDAELDEGALVDEQVDRARGR